MQSPSIFEPDRAAQVMTLVAQVYGVPVDQIAHSRAWKDSAARQVAIYLAHVVFAMKLGDLSSAFGRARSTTLHAVRRVEAARDDPHIDRTLDWLESLLRATTVETVQ